MVRRTLVIALFVAVVLALAAVPALAYEASASYVVDQHARLVEGPSQAVYMWPAAGGADLMAARISPGTGQAGPYTVVTGIVAPGAWYAAGDGLNVTVVWKDGGSVYVTRMDLSTPGGTGAYAPKVLCTDADAVAASGGGATVTPSGVAADGQGGAYVWCTLSLDSTDARKGNTFVNHISADGDLAQPAPGQLAANGTIAGMAAVGGGDALALLASPGRSQVTARRYAADLSAEWTRSPYLFPPSSVASSEPVGVVGGADAAVAWREGGKIKVQRFTETGSPKYLSPPAVTMAGSVEVAADGAGGLYLVAPSGTGLVARHVLVSGLQASWDPSTFAGVGADPRVYGLANNEAGDLFVVSGDASAVATRGVSLLTYTGAWSDVGPATAPQSYSGVAPDGAGGAWAMGNGSNAALWRISNVADQLTFRPRAKLVQYGKSVTLSGYYLTAIGDPPAGAGTVVSIGTVGDSQLSVKTTAQIGADGFYSTTVKPAASAVWSAAADGTAAESVAIQVAPKVTMTMSHLKAGTRLSEILSGSVSPNHKGKKVLVQKAAGKSWKTVASGRLDSRSRYRVTWYLPHKTATHKLRVVLPAHGDHAQGTSPTGTLRVKIRRG